MTDKYVYLYKITLSKEGEDPLYYFGIRVCKCLPENDSYMGSPKAYKDMWKDNAYTKTKEILKIGSYDEDYDSFRDEEPEIIKESWQKYGIYGQGGQSLNGTSGKSIHPYFTSGERSHMKRQEVKDKVFKTRREKYGKSMVSPEGLEKMREASRRPEVIAKRVATTKKRWEDNPDLYEEWKHRIRESVSGENAPAKRPEVRKKISESAKKRCKEGRMSHIFSPENRKKIADSNRRRFEDNPELRVELSNRTKKMYQDRPEIQKKMSDARKKWYIDNPEKAASKSEKLQKWCQENKAIRSANTKKQWEEWRKKKQTNSLENYFD